MPRPTNRAVADRIVRLIRLGVRRTYQIGKGFELFTSTDRASWELTTQVPRYGTWYVASARPGNVWVDPPLASDKPTAENYRHARIAQMVVESLYTREQWVLQRPWPTKLPAYGGDRSLRGPWVYQELAQLPEDA